MWLEISNLHRTSIISWNEFNLINFLLNAVINGKNILIIRMEINGSVIYDVFVTKYNLVKSCLVPLKYLRYKWKFNLLIRIIVTPTFISEKFWSFCFKPKNFKFLKRYSEVFDCQAWNIKMFVQWSTEKCHMNHFEKVFQEIIMS